MIVVNWNLDLISKHSIQICCSRQLYVMRRMKWNIMGYIRSIISFCCLFRLLHHKRRILKDLCDVLHLIRNEYICYIVFIITFVYCLKYIFFFCVLRNFSLKLSHLYVCEFQYNCYTYFFFPRVINERNLIP